MNLKKARAIRKAIKEVFGPQAELGAHAPLPAFTKYARNGNVTLSHGQTAKGLYRMMKRKA